MTSLVGYWPMQGNSNDSYSTNNGTDTSASYSSSSGKVGQYLVKGTGASYVSLPSGASVPLDLTGSRSIAFWIKTSGNSGLVFGFGDSNAATGGYVVSLGEAGAASGVLACLHGNGSGGGWYLGTTAVNNGAWHHVAVVYDASANTVKFYIDGSLDVTRSSVVSVASYSGNRRLGRRSTLDEANIIAMNLDEIGIWSKALSATEVTDLYNSGNGQTLINVTSQALTTSASGTVSLSRAATYGKALTVLAAGSASLVNAITFAKTLAVSAAGAVEMTFARVLGIALNVVAAGSVDLTKAFSYVKNMAVSASGVVSLDKLGQYYRNLTVSAAGSVVLSNAMMFVRSLTVTAGGVVSLLRIKTYFVTLSITALAKIRMWANGLLVSLFRDKYSRPSTAWSDKYPRP